MCSSGRGCHVPCAGLLPSTVFALDRRQFQTRQSSFQFIEGSLTIMDLEDFGLDTMSAERLVVPTEPAGYAPRYRGLAERRIQLNSRSMEFQQAALAVCGATVSYALYERYRNSTIRDVPGPKNPSWIHGISTDYFFLKKNGISTPPTC